jgi:POT family proton-dependent oligopeptide transporter
MVPLGGYLGDNVLGTKRTIVLGLIVLVLGYLLLAFATHDGVFFALGLICVGSGLFKANPSNLLSKCYKAHDSRLHAGFTLYYMAINLGSIVALLVAPTVASHFGYSYAYFLSVIGLSIGLINYWFQRHCVADINNLADQRAIKRSVWLQVFAAMAFLSLGSAYLLHHVFDTGVLMGVITGITLFIYLKMMMGEKKESRMRMLVALVLMLEAIGFFILYQQMPTSLTLFAVHNVRPILFGVSFDPQSFQALNPFWIICLGPVLAKFYTYMQRVKLNLSTPYKFALGMLCCGASFFMLYFARFYPDSMGLVSAWWLVISYLLQSIGELLVSALGVAMVAELVPASMTGFVMGMWFLTTAIAGLLGASVASYTALPPNLEQGFCSLLVYTEVFGRIGLATLTIGLLMGLLARPLSRYFRR